jgi:hypothetical protein
MHFGVKVKNTGAEICLVTESMFCMEK